MGENSSEEEKKSIKSSTKLLQKLETLEKEYQEFIQTSSITKKCNTFDNLEELENSPRNLITALQQHPTTTKTKGDHCHFRIVLHQLSFQEKVVKFGGLETMNWPLRRSLEGIENSGLRPGRLRGRRLFEDDSDVNYVSEDVHSVCDEISEVKEVNEEFREVYNVKSHGIGKLMLTIVCLLVFILVSFVCLGRYDENVTEVKVVIPT